MRSVPSFWLMCLSHPIQIGFARKKCCCHRLPLLWPHSLPIGKQILCSWLVAAILVCLKNSTVFDGSDCKSFTRLPFVPFCCCCSVAAAPQPIVSGISKTSAEDAIVCLISPGRVNSDRASILESISWRTEEELINGWCELSLVNCCWRLRSAGIRLNKASVKLPPGLLVLPKKSKRWRRCDLDSFTL